MRPIRKLASWQFYLQLKLCANIAPVVFPLARDMARIAIIACFLD